jgi:K+-transporting ATPase KdpF subunit
MPLLYVIGGAVSLGLLVYLFVALLKPESVLVSWQGYAQIVVRHPRRSRSAPSWRASWRGSPARQGVLRSRTYALGCSSSTRSASSSRTPSSACRASSRSTRRGSRVSPDLSWNTAVSFVTNTNWQSYGGETTMSYFTQMLALAVQNFVCAASGMAVLVALVRGFARKTSDDDRQLLGRSRPQHALHPPAALARLRGLPRVAGGRADLRAYPRDAAPGDRRTRTARPSPSRSSPLGPVASQIAIKSSARTAAASSTRTRRTRSRTRRRSPTS